MRKPMVPGAQPHDSERLRVIRVMRLCPGAALLAWLTRQLALADRVLHSKIGRAALRVLTSPASCLLPGGHNPVGEAGSLTVILAHGIIRGAMLSYIALCAFLALVQMTVAHHRVSVELG